MVRTGFHGLFIEYLIFLEKTLFSPKDCKYKIICKNYVIAFENRIENCTAAA